MRALGLVVLAVVGAGCATTYVSPARFVSRSPAGGVVATPRAEVGMDDANNMIAAHCGRGGFAISREGEALVGDTVVVEGANSVDAQTTDGSGQVQAHESAKTVYARGSDWQVHYTCNDASTVNMGLITRSRTEPSRLAWGADVMAGAMIMGNRDYVENDTGYGETRGGSSTALGANGWLGYRVSEQLALGAGLGIIRVVAMPQWDYGQELEQDATGLEIFATARYAIAPRVGVGVRVGMAEWDNVRIEGAAPLAAIQLGYRVIDTGANSGVYLGAGVASYISSSLKSNVTPALTIGFQ